ncbi:MAG: hypothetical protein Q4D38_14960, partial [Planctomycetia bacterium]|nr:hypothetical protein [Planctomycetia bacterium]
ANFWKDVIFSKQNICVVSALSEQNHVVRFSSLQVAIMQGTPQSDYVESATSFSQQAASDSQMRSKSSFSGNKTSGEKRRVNFPSSQFEFSSDESESVCDDEKCRTCLFKRFFEAFPWIYRLFREWLSGLSLKKSQATGRRRNSRSDSENSPVEPDSFDPFARRKNSDTIREDSSQTNRNKKGMLDDFE